MLKNRLKFNAKETKIVLGTKISKEMFLKLLDDDFLKSDLTKLLYDSELKDTLAGNEKTD